MIELFLLFSTAFCWCPFLHQAISRQFSYENFPYITIPQRQAFITGSIYADGVDKSITHNVQRIREILNNLDPESEIYWFFVGNYAHIASDVFAHAGRSRSFIVSHGIKHHISEVIVDSLIVKKYNPPYITISPTLRQSLDSMGIRFVKSFRFLYPLISFVTKLPIYKFLPKIQSDSCTRGGFDLSVCNFMNHYSAMLDCMRLSFDHIANETFTELRLKELSIRLLYNIQCCEVDPLNQSYEQANYLSHLSPLLSQQSI